MHQIHLWYCIVCGRLSEILLKTASLSALSLPSTSVCQGQNSQVGFLRLLLRPGPSQCYTPFKNLSQWWSLHCIQVQSFLQQFQGSTEANFSGPSTQSIVDGHCFLFVCYNSVNILLQLTSYLNIFLPTHRLQLKITNRQLFKKFMQTIKLSFLMHNSSNYIT